jgi:hypothetical protein
MKRAGSRLGQLAVVALSASLTAACHGSEPPPTASSTTGGPATAPASPSTSLSASTETQDQAKQNALAAYLGLLDAFEHAGQVGDPASPELPKYAADSVVNRLSTALAKQKKDGILGRGQTVHHAAVTSIGPPDAPKTAQVKDCMDTRKTSLYKPDGQPVPQDKGGFRLTLANLQRIDGAWKVTRLAIREPGTCKP